MSDPLFNLASEAGLEEKAEEQAHLTEQKIVEQQGATAPPEFYWSEQIPGEGERPEWMKSKYKSVEDQAKAYLELEKQFGGFTGKPENYDFVTPLEKHGLDWDKEGDIGKKLAGVFEHYNASQEFVEGVMDVFGEYEASRRVTREDIMTNLGESGERMVNTISNYAVENLSAEEVGVLETMMMTSEQVQLVNKLFVNLFGDPQLASPQEVSAHTPRRSKETVMAEMQQALKDGTYNEKAKSFKEELAKYVS